MSARVGGGGSRRHRWWCGAALVQPFCADETTRKINCTLTSNASTQPQPFKVANKHIPASAPATDMRPLGRASIAVVYYMASLSSFAARKATFLLALI